MRFFLIFRWRSTIAPSTCIIIALLDLEFVLLAVEDVLPVVEVLVVHEFHIEVRHTGGVVGHLIDILGWDGGRDYLI